MTALGLAWQAWRQRRRLATLALAGLVVAWMAFGVLLAPLGQVGPAPGPLTPTPPPAAGGELDGIPVVYLAVYQAAAARYHVPWALLAAVHHQESDFSQLHAPAARGDAVSSGWNGCGAAGPMQFGIVALAPYDATVTDCPGSPRTGAGDSWRAFRDAARGLARPASYPQMAGRLPGCRATAPHGCVYDDVDAVAAAADYLRQLGADSTLDEHAWEAARAYNGTSVYADLVLAQARAYQAAAGSAFTAPTSESVLPGAPVPTAPGARAVLEPDGRAAAPADAPAAVRGAVAAANAISDRPYLLVHYPTHIDNPTYDCSSATSHVLWGAGQFGTAPWTSGQLMRYGDPGPGRWISVYANTGHAFIVVAGLRFDTGRYDTPGSPTIGQSGPRWRLGPRPSSDFVVRHPPGL